MGQQGRIWQQTFEVAEDSSDTYQVIKPCCDNKLKIEDVPQRKRRFFWWLKNGWGRPKKLQNLESIEREPTWSSKVKRDWYKPIQMLTYPQASS